MNMPPQSVLTKLVVSLVIGLVAIVLPLWGLTGLVSTIISIVACIEWAKIKGLSPWWGAIGILGIIGWIIMLFVPNGATAGSTGNVNSNYPR